MFNMHPAEDWALHGEVLGNFTIPTFSGKTRDFAKFKRDFESLVVPDRYPMYLAHYLRDAVPKEFQCLLCLTLRI